MLLQRQNEAMLKRLRAADGAIEENRQLKLQLQHLVRRGGKIAWLSRCWLEH